MRQLVHPQLRACGRLVGTRGAGEAHLLVLALDVALQVLPRDGAELAQVAAERALACKRAVLLLVLLFSLTTCMY